MMNCLVRQTIKLFLLGQTNDSYYQLGRPRNIFGDFEHSYCDFEPEVSEKDSPIKSHESAKQIISIIKKINCLGIQTINSSIRYQTFYP